MELTQEIGDPVAASQAEQVFDFTAEAICGTLLDPESKRVYYLLSRAAKLAKDKGALPDGKTYTQSQVIEILGEDYEKSLALSPNCCK